MKDLNSKDLHTYKIFLKRMQETMIDKELDKYLPIIMDFIELEYKSDDHNNYSLEDFIQECFAEFYREKNDETLDEERFSHIIRKTYKEMNENQKITENTSEEQCYEINSDINFDFDIALQKAEKNISELKNDKQLEAFNLMKNKEYIELDSEDRKEICKQLGITPSNFQQTYSRTIYRQIRDAMRRSKFSDEYHIEDYKKERYDNYNWLYINILYSPIYRYTDHFVDELKELPLRELYNHNFAKEIKNSIMNKLYEEIGNIIIRRNNHDLLNELMYIRYLNGEYNPSHKEEIDFITDKLNSLLNIVNDNYINKPINKDDENQLYIIKNYYKIMNDIKNELNKISNRKELRTR